MTHLLKRLALAVLVFLPGVGLADGVDECLQSLVAGDYRDIYNFTSVCRHLSKEGGNRLYTAVEKYRSAAEHGNADAQHNLGLVEYWYGSGKGNVNQEVMEWLRKATESYRSVAKQGDAKAQYKLGVMYLRSLGVEKNFQESLKWLTKSANQGNVDAQVQIAHIHYPGLYGGGKNFVEAAKWYHEAADQGDAEAQYYLGRMYEFGKGVRKDEHKAIKLYEKALRQGYFHALRALVVDSLFFYPDGLVKDKGEIAKWLRVAAEQGHIDSQNDLAAMYSNGDGVPQDKRKAAEWYRKAADQGSIVAQSNLGKAYYNGEGVVRNYHEAARWFREPADRGVASAQYYLGNMYAEGKGVPADAQKAYVWLLLAASKIKGGDVLNQVREALDKVEAMLNSKQIKAAQEEATRRADPTKS